MSALEVILRLLAVLLLVPLLGYLFSRHRHRVSDRLAEKLDESKLNGTAMDVSILRPRLQRVRANHALHARSHEAAYRASLLARARQTLSRLAYFHDEAEEQHPQAKPCR